jgi:hypothetical protein
MARSASGRDTIAIGMGSAYRHHRHHRYHY